MSTKKPKKAEKKAAAKKGAVAVAPDAEAKAAELAKKAAAAAKSLEPIAREVVGRGERMLKQDITADNHRIAIALQLVKAEDICKEAGMSFRKWYDAEIGNKPIGERVSDKAPIYLGYEAMRKLVQIGRSDNPQLALDDQRHKNRAANQKLREVQKSIRQHEKASGTANAASKAPTVAPVVQVVDMLKKIADNQALDAITGHAKALGFAVVPKEKIGVGGLKAEFEAMKAKEKLEFLTWACALVGGKFVEDFDIAAKPKTTDETIGDVPAALRRGPAAPAPAAQA